jgi:hypothetical protein
MDESDSIEIGSGYPARQLAAALAAVGAARTQDETDWIMRRASTWLSVLAGMSSGRLRIGSRQPIKDLPVWVTPSVVRGGFATGRAVGEGLDDDERELARRVGAGENRGAVFRYLMSDPGLELLGELLDAGTYRATTPEQTAGLVIAWLLRRGHSQAVVELLETIDPYADRVRFWPQASTAADDLDRVARRTAGDTIGSLQRKRFNPQVAVQQEALIVWAPLADEFLALFTTSSGEFDVATLTNPSLSWQARATELGSRYSALAKEHKACSKHRRPKENLFILRTAAEQLASGLSLTRRDAGLLGSVVTAMVTKRGAPGSHELERRRAADLTSARAPLHSEVSSIIVDRLRLLDPDRGIDDTASVLAPVNLDGSVASAPPPSVVDLVERATCATIEELLERRLVPSSESLARLVPEIAAQAIATRFDDEPLRRVAATNYLAFRRRRSLLLLNLQSQIRLHELPWVTALDEVQNTASTSGGVQRVADLILSNFPATAVPNVMVRELDTLARTEGTALPFVEELAADIFMGTFSTKFRSAAVVAAGLLTGSIYDRYYDIDYRAAATAMTAEARDPAAKTSAWLDAWCSDRMPNRDGWSVARNGAIIEQCQIMTTHNLATLAAAAGLSADVAGDRADRCFVHVRRLVATIEGNPRPLRTIKNAAYAWRHAIFFLSLIDDRKAPAHIAAWHASLRRESCQAIDTLASFLDDLQAVALEDPRSARPFTGWVNGAHPLRPQSK